MYWDVTYRTPKFSNFYNFWNSIANNRSLTRAAWAKLRWYRHLPGYKVLPTSVSVFVKLGY